MPWQDKRRTRALIEKAVTSLRDETLETLRAATTNLEKVTTQVGDLAKSLTTVEDSMRTLRAYSDRETKKLAALLEGAVRITLAREHGREYTLARKLGSLRDVLCYA